MNTHAHKKVSITQHLSFDDKGRNEALDLDRTLISLAKVSDDQLSAHFYEMSGAQLYDREVYVSLYYQMGRKTTVTPT